VDELDVGQNKMKNTKLASKIKRTFKTLLEPIGFTPSGSRIYVRNLNGLRQGVEFQPGRGHLDGQFTVNVFWSYTHQLDDKVSMDATKRIGQIAGLGDKWFSSADGELDASFSAIENLIMVYALPYLARYDEIHKILDAYQLGAISEHEAFGDDAGWRNFNLGYCFYTIGNYGEAMRHYQLVISNHSNDPYDWVKDRAHAANEQIQRIQAQQ
jgi:tetratricopeptide (TPR) repeat protein